MSPTFGVCLGNATWSASDTFMNARAGVHILMLYLWQIALLRLEFLKGPAEWLGLYVMSAQEPAHNLIPQVTSYILAPFSFAIHPSCSCLLLYIKPHHSMAIIRMPPNPSLSDASVCPHQGIRAVMVEYSSFNCIAPY